MKREHTTCRICDTKKQKILRNLLKVLNCAKMYFFSVKTLRALQVRIQDLVKGGPQLLRLKVANIVKRSCASEVSKLRLGSRARLRTLEAFGFLMLKYAFSHILETHFL